MNAIIFQGPGEVALVDKPIPELEAPTDAIVRMLKMSICGTDLHILWGDLPKIPTGRTLGHEGVGIVEEVGPNVSGFQRGDKVIVSCITSCGACAHCRKGMYSHCCRGGWMLGNTIDGTQAEYVRVPFADTSLHLAPFDVDESALTMVSDILPTGFECGVLNGKVQPGDNVAIIGAGPVGLATLLTAQFFSPANVFVIDMDRNRLKAAKRLGASRTLVSLDGNVVKRILQYTDGQGVDVAIEAVGSGETFNLCQDIIKPGGHIANIGIHGKRVDLHLEKLWSRNVTITTRLVDTTTTQMLLNIVRSGRIHPEYLVTHHFRLGDALAAYETFEHAAEKKAIKVILSNQ